MTTTFSVFEEALAKDLALLLFAGLFLGVLNGLYFEIGGFSKFTAFFYGDLAA